jgi:hypothetical protein
MRLHDGRTRTRSQDVYTMRRYVILYRRGTGDWGRLTAGVHRGLYHRPEIKAAVVLHRDNPAAEGVAVRLGDEIFNVMVTVEPKTENTFAFEESPC